MPTYAWKNKKTGEVVDVTRPVAEANVPPDSGEKDDWERVYSFGVGRVEGAGGSPGRVTKVKK